MNESKLETNRYPASRIVEVAKALSSDVRVRILEALGDKPMSVGQLAEALGIAQPTVSINVQMLEQAELIVSSQGANREKICAVTCRSILLELPSKPGEGLQRTEEIHMPIGMFSHCFIEPTCGMAARDGSLIGSPDDPRAFTCRNERRLRSSGSRGRDTSNIILRTPCRPVRPSMSCASARN